MWIRYSIVLASILIVRTSSSIVSFYISKNPSKLVRHSLFVDVPISHVKREVRLQFVRSIMCYAVHSSASNSMKWTVCTLQGPELITSLLLYSERDLRKCLTSLGHLITPGSVIYRHKAKRKPKNQSENNNREHNNAPRVSHSLGTINRTWNYWHKQHIVWLLDRNGNQSSISRQKPQEWSDCTSSITMVRETTRTG